MNRREFLKASTVAAASGILLPGNSIAQLAPVRRIGVRLRAQESLKTRLAVNESGRAAMEERFRGSRGSRCIHRAAGFFPGK